MRKRKPNIWDEPGIDLQAEEIEIAFADEWAYAAVEIVMPEDGLWYSRPFFRDCTTLCVEDPAVADYCTHATRREAIDFHIANARGFFERRLKDADNGGYRAAEVRRDAEIIIAQIDELMARKQMDLFD